MVTHLRLNLWSSPRNISTALMYSFAQRKDTTVVDEPLYAHYLLHQPTQADHPGHAAVLAGQEGDGRRVVDRLLHHDYGTPVAIFKQMTHHLVELDLDFLDRMQHVLLIRDPREILSSFGKVVTKVTAMDIGLPQQAQLFDLLCTRLIPGAPTPANAAPAVVDARRLLEDPQGVLTRLCDRLGIDFDPAMLSWPAGPKPYDGSWAEHWYAGVHQSTGFLPYHKKDIALSPTLAEIAEACTPTYQHLLSHAL